nr:hypothetical protein GCM10025730_01500 [Promicromonospora thailandica]
MARPDVVEAGLGDLPEHLALQAQEEASGGLRQIGLHAAMVVTVGDQFGQERVPPAG